MEHKSTLSPKAIKRLDKLARKICEEPLRDGFVKYFEDICHMYAGEVFTKEDFGTFTDKFGTTHQSDQSKQIFSGLKTKASIEDVMFAFLERYNKVEAVSIIRNIEEGVIKDGNAGVNCLEGEMKVLIMPDEIIIPDEKEYKSYLNRLHFATGKQEKRSIYAEMRECSEARRKEDPEGYKRAVEANNKKTESILYHEISHSFDFRSFQNEKAFSVLEGMLISDSKRSSHGKLNYYFDEPKNPTVFENIEKNGRRMFWEEFNEIFAREVGGFPLKIKPAASFAPVSTKFAVKNCEYDRHFGLCSLIRRGFPEDEFDFKSLKFNPAKFDEKVDKMPVDASKFDESKREFVDMVESAFKLVNKGILAPEAKADIDNLRRSVSHMSTTDFVKASIGMTEFCIKTAEAAKETSKESAEELSALALKVQAPAQATLLEGLRLKIESKLEDPQYLLDPKNLANLDGSLRFASDTLIMTNGALKIQTSQPDSYHYLPTAAHFSVAKQCEVFGDKNALVLKEIADMVQSHIQSLPEEQQTEIYSKLKFFEQQQKLDDTLAAKSYTIISAKDGERVLREKVEGKQNEDAQEMMQAAQKSSSPKQDNGQPPLVVIPPNNEEQQPTAPLQNGNTVSPNLSVTNAAKPQSTPEKDIRKICSQVNSLNKKTEEFYKNNFNVSEVNSGDRLRTMARLHRAGLELAAEKITAIAKDMSPEEIAQLNLQTGFNIRRSEAVVGDKTIPRTYVYFNGLRYENIQKGDSYVAYDQNNNPTIKVAESDISRLRIDTEALPNAGVALSFSQDPNFNQEARQALAKDNTQIFSDLGIPTEVFQNNLFMQPPTETEDPVVPDDATLSSVNYSGKLEVNDILLREASSLPHDSIV